MCPCLPNIKSSPLTPIQWDRENTGKEFAFPKLKIQFGSDETQVGQLPSQTSEVAEVTNFIVAGSHKIWIWNYVKTPLLIECFNKCKKKTQTFLKSRFFNFVPSNSSMLLCSSVVLYKKKTSIINMTRNLWSHIWILSNQYNNNTCHTSSSGLELSHLGVPSSVSSVHDFSLWWIYLLKSSLKQIHEWTVG